MIGINDDKIVDINRYYFATKYLIEKYKRILMLKLYKKRSIKFRALFFFSIFYGIYIRKK